MQTLLLTTEEDGTLMDHTHYYFGEPWRGPHFQYCPVQQVPTPVGDECRHCDDPVVEGDRGFMRPHAVMVGGYLTAILVPLHAECEIVERFGGVEHVTGRCNCPTPWKCSSYDGTRRQEAIAVMILLNAMRVCHSQPTLW